MTSPSTAQVPALTEFLVSVFRTAEGQAAAMSRAEQFVAAVQKSDIVQVERLLAASPVSKENVRALQYLFAIDGEASDVFSTIEDRLRVLLETDEWATLHKEAAGSAAETATIVEKILAARPAGRETSESASRFKSLMIEFCTEHGARMANAAANIVKLTTALVSRHRKLDRDDLVQDAIIRLKNKCPQVLSIDGNRLAYFRVLVGNLVRDYYRAYYRGLSLIESDTDAIQLAADYVPDSVREEIDLAEASSQALGRLADVLTVRQREVLELWLQSQTTNQIAKALSISIDRVKEIKEAIRLKAQGCLGRSFNEAICAH